MLAPVHHPCCMQNRGLAVPLQVGQGITRHRPHTARQSAAVKVVSLPGTCLQREVASLQHQGGRHLGGSVHSRRLASKRSQHVWHRSQPTFCVQGCPRLVEQALMLVPGLLRKELDGHLWQQAGRGQQPSVLDARAPGGWSALPASPLSPSSAATLPRDWSARSAPDMAAALPWSWGPAGGGHTP